MMIFGEFRVHLQFAWNSLCTLFMCLVSYIHSASQRLYKNILDISRDCNTILDVSRGCNTILERSQGKELRPEMTFSCSIVGNESQT